MHVQALERQALSGPHSRAAFANRFNAASVPSFCVLLVSAALMVTCTTRDAEPLDLSVRDIVKDPHAVDGKLVRLSGLLHHTADGEAFFWPEATENKPSLESQGVAVHYSSSAPMRVANDEADGSYVTLEGIFYVAKPPRRRISAQTTAVHGRFNGALVDARPVETR